MTQPDVIHRPSHVAFLLRVPLNLVRVAGATLVIALLLLGASRPTAAVALVGGGSGTHQIDCPDPYKPCKCGRTSCLP